MAQLMFMKCLLQIQDGAVVVTKTRLFLSQGISHDTSPVKTGDPVKCGDLINKDLVCRSLQIVQSSLQKI
jgi:CxxC motif-containing protein